MVMRTGERWCCIDKKCGCSVLVEAGGSTDGANPRCACGSVMKKEFKPPILSYLDFLHVDPPLVPAEKPEQG